MVVFGQSGCNWANVLISDKLVVFGQNCFYSSKLVVFGQNWLHSGRVVVFGQSGCI